MRAWGSVGHYLQGPGIIDHAARYANLFGTRHLFVVDAFVQHMLGDSLFSEYGDLGGSSYDLVTFEGEISRGSVERVRREAGAGHDVIVAVGGGKVIDVAKMLAADGAALVVCPTIAATDAPTSAMSILYSDEGEMNDIVIHVKNPDLVLVDPPRAGLAPEVIDLISDAAPRAVVYVSCDPATLARDLARFRERGTYEPVSVTPVDLFPQTYHVETVTHLVRRP